MFFFIGGLQPRTIKLDERSRICPACGLYQAKLVRVDHYLSLFFIPLIPVKKGNPALRCDRCGHLAAETGEPVAPAGSTDMICLSCGRTMEKSFRFCPNCGKPASSGKRC